VPGEVPRTPSSLLYSTSFASSALFGDRLEEFDAAARAILAGHSDDGQFTEDNESRSASAAGTRYDSRGHGTD
jgi:hypothetical protein